MLAARRCDLDGGRGMSVHRQDRPGAPAVTVDELLAVAAAAGVLRTADAPAVASHRSTTGRRVPAWLVNARPPRRPGWWQPIVRALGLLLGATGAGVTGSVVAFGLAVPATGAALLGLVVALVAAVVLR